MSFNFSFEYECIYTGMQSKVYFLTLVRVKNVERQKPE